MSSALCCVAAMVLSAPADARVVAPKPDEPDDLHDVLTLRLTPMLRLEGDADGNIGSINYFYFGRDVLPVQSIDAMKRLQHVRKFETGTMPREAYIPLLRAWPGLRELLLDRVDAETMDAVSAMPALRVLRLRSETLPDAAMQHLTGPPTLEALHFGEHKLSDAALAGLHRLTGLRTLRLFQATVGDAALAHIGRAAGLRTLQLTETRISSAGMPHLAGLTELRTLDISRTRVSDNGLPPLAALKNLESLDLSDTEVEGPGLAALKGLSRLRELDLRYNGVAEEAVAGLRAIPGLKIQGVRTKEEMLTADPPGVFAALREAGLRVNRDYDGKILGICAQPPEIHGNWAGRLKGLRALRAAELFRLTDADVANLADAPSLERVRVFSPLVTDAGLAPLARLPNLTWLELARCVRITDEGLAHLGKIKSLEYLGLSDTPIKGPGLRHLSALENLKGLDLAGSAITDDGLAGVAAIPNLLRLGLDRTAVTDAGLVHLYGMRHIRVVSGNHTAITAEGYAKLAKEATSIDYQRTPPPRRPAEK